MIVAPLLLAAVTPDFAARLWNALPVMPGNVVVSPTSVEACLGLLVPAVGPESRPALAKTLGTDALPAYETKLQDRLRGLAVGGEATISNGFFSTETPLATYVAAIAKGYGAKAERLQPGPAGLRQVNGWVNAKTKGRISKLFDRLSASHAVLVNAVTFDGSWAVAFETTATHKADFKGLSGVRQVDTMRNDGLRIPYAEAKGFRMVQLAYAGGRYRMTILLPDAGDPAALLRGGEWRTAEPKVRPVHVSLPKFTVRSSPDVESALKAMGLAPFFRHVDLSRALPTGKNDQIDQIVHKAYIEVDERGTKAAAATGVAVTRAIMRPMPPVEFRVDRPFAFAIQRVGTDEILFEGVIRSPGG